MKVPGWAEANIEEFADIQRRKDNRESNSLIGCCSTIANDRSLFPLIEKTPQGLNSVSPAERVLIDVIADSGACEIVMPKALCSNIALRESAASRAGVKYEVASGKAVPNLGERHCEILCEGAESSMMMHFQVADILSHRAELQIKDSGVILIGMAATSRTRRPARQFRYNGEGTSMSCR